MNQTRQLSAHPPTLLPKAVYFLYFAAMASLMPYLTLHYQGLGLSGRQIGLLAGIGPFVTVISAPLWGGAADATKRHRASLLTAVGGAWLAIFLLSQVTTFSLLVPVMVVYAFFVAPVVPLIDNAVIDLLAGRRNQYGKVRLWGAIGWGSVATVAGLVLERIGLDFAFIGYLVFLAGLWIAAYHLPVGRAQIAGQLRQGLQILTANKRWLLFLFIVLIQGISMSIFMNFLFLHMDGMGASKALMGFSLTTSTLSELLLFSYSDRLLQRFGTQRLLIFSLLMFMLRAFGYGLMPVPWLALPIGFLHGPSFSVMWTAGVAYASETAPPGMGATAQGLFSSTTFGIGGTLGGFLGGLLYDAAGGTQMFIYVGAGLLLGLVVYLVVGRTAVSGPIE